MSIAHTRAMVHAALSGTLDEVETVAEGDAAAELTHQWIGLPMFGDARPPARLVITLLEIEDRSVKEIAKLTGWSVPLVKVRAFRARGEMRKIVAKIAKDKYL